MLCESDRARHTCTCTEFVGCGLRRTCVVLRAVSLLLLSLACSSKAGITERSGQRGREISHRDEGDAVDISIVVSLLDVGCTSPETSWGDQRPWLGLGAEGEEGVLELVDMLARFPWASAYGVAVEVVLILRSERDHGAQGQLEAGIDLEERWDGQNAEAKVRLGQKASCEVGYHKLRHSMAGGNQHRATEERWASHRLLLI